MSFQRIPTQAGCRSRADGEDARLHLQGNRRLGMFGDPDHTIVIQKPEAVVTLAYRLQPFDRFDPKMARNHRTHGYVIGRVGFGSHV